ncbi:hypothetical protein [Cryobacterium sp. TMB1-7]|uniref:hypothetical protein n=1 Tax=Cryobacterium sp. TMB1-7 TaxID=2555866 RepID=UPI0010694B2B|nr:hypothetical protein [Cryobacterium sp. TMB1-7]TFC61745.1 hypothetical protein E3O60_04200 [Cryobacterium sp. TMB1-7]
MRRIYSAIAWTVAAGVLVQAAAIAFGVGGMVHFVQEGGVVDKALLESRQLAYTGELGFWIHAIVGAGVIPLAAVALLIVAFFVRVPRARLWAAIVLGLIVAQVTLGFALRDIPYLGLIHGANALAVLSAAVFTAVRVRQPSRANREEAKTDAVAA